MWKDLTLQEKAEIMKMSVANGVTDINDIIALYDDSIPNQFDDGGFVNFYNSLPRNQRDSTNYNVRRYWELNGKPKDFNEAIQRGMYTKQSDGWHANSVAYNEAKDEYEFMKSPTHPTAIYEIGAYLNNKDFQKEYYLDYTSKPNYKYRRKPSWMYDNGGHLYKGGGSKSKKNKSTVDYHLNDAQGFIEELIAAGVDPTLAIGVGGNVWVESRFNANASNNINGGHWGLVQNDANIRKHIINHYGDYSRKSQMQFLIDGLTGQIKGAKQAPWLQRRFTDYRKHATGVKDASIAAKYFHDDYEKSNNEAVGDRMRAASIYQGHLSGNPTISAYHKMYGKPDLSISNDVLYNPAQELKWTNITPTIQQTPWYNNVNSNLAMNDFTPQVKPITPVPIEERFPIEELPDIAPLLPSILPDQRMPSYQQVTVPTYQSPMINFDEPYLLFGR